MSKVTAVEWLISELNQKIDFIPMDKWDMIRDIVQNAKAMEKQQIIKFANDYLDDDEDITAEQYYNETYEQ
jgi:adenylate kinase family enzyme